MSDEQPNGRKYWLTKVGLALTALPVVGIFVIAALGKSNTDTATTFAAVLPPYYLAIGVLVTGFNAANAYTTGKAADNDLLNQGNPPNTEAR